MHKPESIRENERCKILRDFEIQTDHVIWARKHNLVIINKKKKTYYLMSFAIRADKWENEWK